MAGVAEEFHFFVFPKWETSERQVRDSFSILSDNHNWSENSVVHAVHYQEVK